MILMVGIVFWNMEYTQILLAGKLDEIFFFHLIRINSSMIYFLDWYSSVDFICLPTRIQ